MNIRISQFGMEFIRDFHDNVAVDGESPLINFHGTGYLFLSEDQDHFAGLARDHAVQVAEGADVRLLRREEVGVEFPYLNTETLVGARIGSVREGSFDSWALLQGMRRRAEHNGVRYLRDTVVGARHGARPGHLGPRGLGPQNRLRTCRERRRYTSCRRPSVVPYPPPSPKIVWSAPKTWAGHGIWVGRWAGNEIWVGWRAEPQHPRHRRISMNPYPLLLALLACATLASCGSEAATTTAPEPPGTVAVHIQKVEGFFIEGFEVGLRFETADGDVIAGTLWNDFVSSQDNPTMEDYYDSVLEQSVPSGTITVIGEANVGIGPGPMIPDITGAMRCRLDVDVPAGGRVDVEVTFDDDADCLRLS